MLLFFNGIILYGAVFSKVNYCSGTLAVPSCCLAPPPCLDHNEIIGATSGAQQQGLRLRYLLREGA